MSYKDGWSASKSDTFLKLHKLTSHVKFALMIKDACSADDIALSRCVDYICSLSFRPDQALAVPWIHGRFDSNFLWSLENIHVVHCSCCTVFTITFRFTDVCSSRKGMIWWCNSKLWFTHGALGTKKEVEWFFPKLFGVALAITKNCWGKKRCYFRLSPLPQWVSLVLH